MCFSRYPLYKVFFNKQLQKCKFTTWKRPKNLSGRNIVKIKDLFQKSHKNFPKKGQYVIISVKHAQEPLSDWRLLYFFFLFIAIKESSSSQYNTYFIFIAPYL